jgi:hypothetical protein
VADVPSAAWDERGRERKVLMETAGAGVIGRARGGSVRNGFTTIIEISKLLLTN